MPKSSPTSPPSAVVPKVKAAVLAVFEKYATFALSPAQVPLEVEAPLPELLLALDELLATKAVRRVGPGSYQHRAGVIAAKRPDAVPFERRRREVTAEGTFIDGHPAPPEVSSPPEWGDDARGALLRAWSQAFALRIVRERGILASTLDRRARHLLGVRRAAERGLKTDRWFNFEGLIADTDYVTVDQVAQTYVDRRAEEIEDVRRWAAKNPDKEARPPEPLAMAVARAHVEKDAILSVSQEARGQAVAKLPHLHRPALDQIWGFVRTAEASPPVAGLSEAEQQRAWKLWRIGHTVLGWALRVEAGKSNEPWLTLGGRPVTPDAHKVWPKGRAPVEVGTFLDKFIEDFSKLAALESAEAMHGDELVAEVRPLLQRYLKQAKELDREWSKTFPNEERGEAITTALYETVEHLAMAHGTPLGDGYRERLLEGFPYIDATEWAIAWTVHITGVGWDIAKQTAARRLKAGPQPKPHNPPPLLRDGQGKVVGLAVPPTPLAVLEVELRSRVLESAAAKRRAAAARKAEAAERKKRKAARKPAKGARRPRF